MLQNKQGIIFGVANKRSIAWATAQATHEAGARLAFAYQGERLKENVERLTAEEMPGSPLISCDVTKQEEVDDAFSRVASEFGRLDFVIDLKIVFYEDMIISIFFICPRVWIERYTSHEMGINTNHYEQQDLNLLF